MPGLLIICLHAPKRGCELTARPNPGLRCGGTPTNRGKARRYTRKGAGPTSYSAGCVVAPDQESG